MNFRQNIRKRAMKRADATSSRATRTVLFKPLDHCVEIGIACAKLSREPVPSPLGNPFAVREHFELTGFTGGEDGVNS
jgi:hypothetical protein